MVEKLVAGLERAKSSCENVTAIRNVRSQGVQKTIGELGPLRDEAIKDCEKDIKEQEDLQKQMQTFLEGNREQLDAMRK